MSGKTEMKVVEPGSVAVRLTHTASLKTWSQILTALEEYKSHDGFNPPFSEFSSGVRDAIRQVETAFYAKTSEDDR